MPGGVRNCVITIESGFCLLTVMEKPTCVDGNISGGVRPPYEFSFASVVSPPPQFGYTKFRRSIFKYFSSSLAEPRVQ